MGNAHAQGFGVPKIGHRARQTRMFTDALGMVRGKYHGRKVVWLDPIHDYCVIEYRKQFHPKRSRRMAGK